MIESPNQSYYLFHEQRLVEIGPLSQVALKARQILRQVNHEESVLVFDGNSGRTVDLDRRLTDEELLASLQAHESARKVETGIANQAEGQNRSRGRPKLGVVAKEVTLLPRHWEWLSNQPGGVSVTLRKLVEEAKRRNAGSDRKRNAQEACYRFLNTMAGDWPGFEEAIRALFSGDREKFEKETVQWSTDVRETALKLALPSFATNVDA